MIKHIEDNGDIDYLINNDGQALLLCSACKRKWYGKFELIPETEDARLLEFHDQISASPGLLKDLGMDMDMLKP